MPDPRIMRCVCALCLVIFVQIGAVFAQPAMASDHLNNVLQWLPPDSETLIVANGPFAMPVAAEYPKEGVEEARGIPFTLYRELKKGLILKPFEGKKVALALEASRRFTAPNDLGLMRFEGALVVQFDEQEHESLAAAFERCLESADKQFEVNRINVGVFDRGWPGESDDEGWSLFIANPRPGVFLGATNQILLEETIYRMDSTPADERAFPADLPEWEEIDTRAAVWGLRHYRTESARLDPSSPLRPESAANTPDPKAIGFVFCIEEDPKKPARIRYLSTSEDALKIFSSHWSGLSPDLAKLKPNVIGGSAPLTGWFNFVLMMYLGHGIYT